jgi:hypothetical protein
MKNATTEAILAIGLSLSNLHSYSFNTRTENVGEAACVEKCKMELEECREKYQDWVCNMDFRRCLRRCEDK